MRCDEFELRWNDLLDERLSPESDPALAAHVAECRECARLMHDMTFVSAALHAAPLEPLSPDFAVRVSSLAASQWRPATAWAWKEAVQGVAAMAAALAAVLLLSVATMWHVSQQVAAQPGTRATSGLAIGSVGRTGAPNGSHESAAPSPQRMRRPLPWSFSWDRLTLTGRDGQPNQSVLALQRVTGSLRPVASSLSTAWQLLREAFPQFLGEDSHEETPMSQATA
jgi:hypothetical protein